MNEGLNEKLNMLGALIQCNKKVYKVIYHLNKLMIIEGSDMDQIVIDNSKFQFITLDEKWLNLLGFKLGETIKHNSTMFDWKICKTDKNSIYLKEESKRSQNLLVFTVCKFQSLVQSFTRKEISVNKSILEKGNLLLF